MDAESAATTFFMLMQNCCTCLRCRVDGGVGVEVFYVVEGLHVVPEVHVAEDRRQNHREKQHQTRKQVPGQFIANKQFWFLVFCRGSITEVGAILLIIFASEPRRPITANQRQALI